MWVGRVVVVSVSGAVRMPSPRLERRCSEHVDDPGYRDDHDTADPHFIDSAGRRRRWRRAALTSDFCSFVQGSPLCVGPHWLDAMRALPSRLRGCGLNLAEQIKPGLGGCYGSAVRASKAISSSGRNVGTNVASSLIRSTAGSPTRSARKARSASSP